MQIDPSVLPHAHPSYQTPVQYRVNPYPSTYQPPTQSQPTLLQFERALFRVYDRSMEGLVRDQPSVDGVPLTRPSKLCTLLVHTLWISSLTLLGCTAVLHATFVGDSGCIGRALQDLAARNASAAPAAIPPEPPQRRRQLQPAAPPSAAAAAAALLDTDTVLQIRVLGSNPSLMGGGSGWSLNLFPGLDGVEKEAAAAAAMAGSG